jgi:hypothetical protein
MGGHGVACCQQAHEHGRQEAIVDGRGPLGRAGRARAGAAAQGLARSRRGDEYSDVDFLVVAAAGAAGGAVGGPRRDRGGTGRLARRASTRSPGRRRTRSSGSATAPSRSTSSSRRASRGVDPWLRDGFRALVDEHGVADRLRTQLQAPPEPPDLSDFDAHAWDWLWAARLKLRRPGHEWLVYVELVKFVETMLLTGFGALAPEPWRGVLRMEERLPAEAREELRRALPAAPEDAELRRALRATIAATSSCARGSPPSAGCRSRTTSPHRCCPCSPGPDHQHAGLAGVDRAVVGEAPRLRGAVLVALAAGDPLGGDLERGRGDRVGDLSGSSSARSGRRSPSPVPART